MSETEINGDGVAAETAELNDQITKEDSLIDRGVDDPLDEGYVAPDKWSVAQGFGSTPAEMAQGESLDAKLAQEVPDTPPSDPDADWNPLREKREVGSRRAGRLVTSTDQNKQQDWVGEEVGIDGGAACAEEAAVHVIDPSDEDAEAGDESDSVAAR